MYARAMGLGPNPEGFRSAELRGKLRQEKILQDAAAREMVEEARRDGNPKPKSALARLLGRVRRSERL